MSTRTLAIAALLCAVAVVVPARARAQRSSGVQLTPDSQRYLITKDVGVERWAISFNLDDQTVTGNVFKSDGTPPSFIWCKIKSVLPSIDPAFNSYRMDCMGADACTQAPCGGAAWSPIATDLTLDGRFLLPDGTRSTLSGNVQQIFDRSCADSLACHAAGGAGRLDLAAGLSWGQTFLVPARQAVDPVIFYADPFRIETSYIVNKIMGTGFGSQMPLGRAPLPPADMDAIVRWIQEGAANN